jgi:hypothetical protein
VDLGVCNTSSLAAFDASLGVGSLGVCGTTTASLIVALEGVVGVGEGLEITADTGAATGAAAGVVGSILSLFCLPLPFLLGVALTSGVAGTTGTAGVMLEDVVRDIGRDPARERDSSRTALGIAGAVKPGGMVGVDRRGCSKNWPLSGVLGAGRIGSLSLSLTSASTLIDACSSTLKDPSSATLRQH